MKLRLNKQTGFTLLELLVVIVIVGLLASYVAPRYFKEADKSKIKVAQAQIEGLGKALDHYRLDVGRYPSTEQGLAALMERPTNESKWSGPYLTKALPLDPWDRAYMYRSPGEHGEYDIFSYGRDSKAGGSEEDVDIVSW